MAKRTVKEKEIGKYLKEEGFAEVTLDEKKAGWYKKAAGPPSCLKSTKKQRVKI